MPRAPIPYRPLGIELDTLRKPGYSIALVARHLAGARARQQQLAERAMKADKARTKITTQERHIVRKKWLADRSGPTLDDSVRRQRRMIAVGYPQDTLRHVDKQVAALEKLITYKRQHGHPLHRTSTDLGKDD